MANDYPRLSHSVFVTWDPNCARSKAQCQNMGSELLIIDIGRSLPSIFGKLIRYFFSFVATIWKLASFRPAVVFTENMPIFLVGAVALYAKISRIPFIIDSHSGAFNDPKWKWAIPAYRKFARNALVNLNTNIAHKNIVESWGGRSIIVADIPICVESVAYQHGIIHPYLAVATSYAFDEPISEIFQAAQQLPEIAFYLTGNYRKLPSMIVQTKPENVYFTGFTPYPEYLGLLQKALGVIVLTTRDNTMQRGAYEALSLGTPIITSDFQVLRDSFADAAIYVDNTPSGITMAVRKLVIQESTMRTRVQHQRTVRRKKYKLATDKIVALLDTTNN